MPRFSSFIIILAVLLSSISALGEDLSDRWTAGEVYIKSQWADQNKIRLLFCEGKGHCKGIGSKRGYTPETWAHIHSICSSNARLGPLARTSFRTMVVSLTFLSGPAAAPLALMLGTGPFYGVDHSASTSEAATLLERLLRDVEGQAHGEAEIFPYPVDDVLLIKDGLEYCTADFERAATRSIGEFGP